MDVADARDQATAERVARNDAAFREANETIRATAEGWDMQGGLPLICECADPECTLMLRVTTREYEEVRADPRLFFNAPGHEVNGKGWAQVVADHDHYVVVEKIGEAGEIAERLDPRAGEDRE